MHRPSPLQSFDLVIFDCDGVLVDSETLACEGLSLLLARYGIQADIGYVMSQFQGRSLTSLVEHYRERGIELPPGFRDEVRTWIAERFRTALRPVEGVDAILGELGLPRCVASSSERARVELSLRLTGLSRHFGDSVYTAEQVAHGKPAPDLFLYAARRMGADPARTLVIEDSVSGVLAANAARMQVWGFTGGSHYRDRDGAALLGQAGAQRVFDHMSRFWRS